MTKVCNMIPSKSFMMTGAECAVFIAANHQKIAACLRGVARFRHLAVSRAAGSHPRKARIQA